MQILRSYVRTELALLALALLIAVPGIIRWYELRNLYEGDLAVYYLAATLLARGDQTIYTNWPTVFYSAEDGPVVTFRYPPFIGMLFIPATALPFQTVEYIWIAANLVMTAVAVWLTLSALDVRPSRGEWLALGLAIFLFPPLFRTVRQGQGVCLLLLLSAIAFWACVRQKSRLAGFSIALAALIKLYPAVLLAALLVRQWWKAVIAGIVVAGVLMLVTIWLVGWEVHRSFLVDMLPELAVISGTPAQQSLPSFLQRLGLEGTPLTVLSYLASGALTIATFWRIRKQPDWTVIFGLTTVLMLILPTVSWDHNYLLLLVPLLALYFGPWAQRASETRAVVLVVYMLVVLERYWPLYPAWWPLYSFSLYGALLLWVWLMCLPVSSTISPPRMLDAAPGSRGVTTFVPERGKS